MKPNSMTISKIAELSGVSIGTVDRVLHKRGRVSAATKAKVEAVIKKSHYTPNPIAQQLKRNRPFRFFALLPQDQDAGYWNQIITGIERASEEIKPLGVETYIVEYHRHNPSSFARASKSISDEKPDGLLIAPIIPRITLPYIEKTSLKKIPFVYVDSDIPGTKPLSVIGQNPFSGGYLAGKLFHLFAGTVSMPVAIINEHKYDYNLAGRRDGFLHYAKEHNFSVVVKEFSDLDGYEFSEEEIALFLKEYPKLSGLFITNSMAFKVVNAMKKHKNSAPFHLIGYDLVPKNQRLLHEERISAIVAQRPEEQGREALFTLFRSVVLRQVVEARKEIPLDVYIRENAPRLKN